MPKPNPKPQGTYGIFQFPVESRPLLNVGGKGPGWTNPLMNTKKPRQLQVSSVKN